MCFCFSFLSAHVLTLASEFQYSHTSTRTRSIPPTWRRGFTLSPPPLVYPRLVVTSRVAGGHRPSRSLSAPAVTMHRKDQSKKTAAAITSTQRPSTMPHALPFLPRSLRPSNRFTPALFFNPPDYTREGYRPHQQSEITVIACTPMIHLPVIPGAHLQICYVPEATKNPVGTGIGDLWRVYYPGIYPGHSGACSLAITPCVGALITGEETRLL